MSMKPKRVLIVCLVIASLVIAAVYVERRLLLVAAFSSEPALNDAEPELDSTVWFDDYYTVEYIDATTIAIGEPRYHQQNYNYLILGDERALLFDTGPGVRDIGPVVASLTNLPVTVTQSHLHYDHVGNHSKFSDIVFPDLEHLRRLESKGTVPLSASQHLGFVENIETPQVTVSQWLSPNGEIDLGNRTIKMIHAPGHTPDSIVLHDSVNQMLFTGDFIYYGPLFAMLPGSDLEDYYASSQRLADEISAETRLFAAHRDKAPGLPEVGHADLVDLRDGIKNILSGNLEGEGSYISVYPLNERIELWVD